MIDDNKRLSISTELVSLLNLFTKTQKTITQNTFLKADLGIDSVDTLDLMFLLEKQFKIELADKDVFNIESVKDLENVIFQKMLHGEP